MKKRLNQLILFLNKELNLFFSISFGLFLFVLLFQPFPHSEFDFYYRLLFKFGFAAIVFLFMFLTRVFLPCLIGRISQNEKEITLSSHISGFIIWVLSSFAFIFYLKYVGFIGASDYVVFKVVIICAVPPVVLMVSDRMRKLRVENKSFIFEKEKTQNQDKKNDEDYLNLPIEFKSGENGHRFNFILGKILFIKSANNYVEIHYLEDDQIKKKLVRSTLAHIELIIESYPTLIRCHRICIVNTHFIEKLNGNCNNRTLTIRGYHKQIPVSRRYYLKVKEVV